MWRFVRTAFARCTKEHTVKTSFNHRRASRGRGRLLFVRRRKNNRGFRNRRLLAEPLESRAMLAIDLSGIPTWIEQGPGTIQNGNNVEGIANKPQAGAVTKLAPDPTNADRLFVASTNGGVWRTTDATAANPHWEP